MPEGQYGQDRLLTRRLPGTPHFFFFDHKGDHPGARQLISFFHGIISMHRRDHHFPKAVDCHQLLPVDLQKSVDGRPDLDLSLSRQGSRHGR